MKVACYLATKNALKQTYLSTWAQAVYEELINLGVEIKTDIFDASPRNSSWKNTDALFLFTHVFERSSPLCRGDNGAPIPLFRLPISDELREALYFWSKTYSELDSLYLGSGVLETPAYKEMADCNSRLATEGRLYCSEIEQATKRQIYYYLHRYWGRSVGEADRLCPGCGRRWAKESTSGSGLAWFDFQCEPCRLVSHIGVDISDQRRAKIGGWKNRGVEK